MITIAILLWRSLGVMQEGLDPMNCVGFLGSKARDVGMARKWKIWNWGSEIELKLMRRHEVRGMPYG